MVRAYDSFDLLNSPVSNAPPEADLVDPDEERRLRLLREQGLMPQIGAGGAGGTPAAQPQAGPSPQPRIGSGFDTDAYAGGAAAGDIRGGVKDVGAFMRQDPAQAAFERFGGAPTAAEPTSLLPSAQVRTLADGAQVVTDPITGQVFVKEPGGTGFGAPEAPSAMPQAGQHGGDLQGYMQRLAANASPGTPARAAYLAALGVPDPLEGLPIGYQPQVDPRAVPYVPSPGLPNPQEPNPAPGTVTPESFMNQGGLQGGVPDPAGPVASPGQVTPESFMGQQSPGIPGMPAEAAAAPAQDDATRQAANGAAIQAALAGTAPVIKQTGPGADGSTWPVVGMVTLPSGSQASLVRTTSGEVWLHNPDTDQYETDLSPYLGGDAGAVVAPETAQVGQASAQPPQGSQMVDEQTAVDPQGWIWQSRNGVWVRVR